MKNSLTTSVIHIESLQKLKKLQKPGRPDLLTALIKLYFETAEVSLNQIRKALEEKNLSLLVSAAHSLKSSSANLGALEFAKLCERLEATTQSELTTPETFVRIKELDDEYIRVCQELKGYSIAS